MSESESSSLDADGRLLLSRRDVMGLGVAAASAPLIGLAPDADAAAPASAGLAENAIALRLRINGQPVQARIDPRTSLLDMLREQFQLTGAKKGCDHGQCGACTVHVDGHSVASCLTLAAKVAQREVVTIEGLAAADGTLHPMQQAFIDHDALQCGYCTPGQIMAAVACVRDGHAASEAAIKEAMIGNLCRCGAYDGIVAAIQDAAATMEAR